MSGRGRSGGPPESLRPGRRPLHRGAVHEHGQDVPTIRRCARARATRRRRRRHLGDRDRGRAGVGGVRRSRARPRCGGFRGGGPREPPADQHRPVRGAEGRGRAALRRGAHRGRHRALRRRAAAVRRRRPVRRPVRPAAGCAGQRNLRRPARLPVDVAGQRRRDQAGPHGSRVWRPAWGSPAPRPSAAGCRRRRPSTRPATAPSSPGRSPTVRCRRRGGRTPGATSRTGPPSPCRRTSTSPGPRGR